MPVSVPAASAAAGAGGDGLDRQPASASITATLDGDWVIAHALSPPPRLLWLPAAPAAAAADPAVMVSSVVGRGTCSIAIGILRPESGPARTGVCWLANKSLYLTDERHGYFSPY